MPAFPSPENLATTNWQGSGSVTCLMVFHRMAIDDVCKGKGAAPAFFRFAEELCRERDSRSIRVDTDADNRMMQRVLEKQGFTYCGTVCFDNSEKIAFEKLL